MNDTDANVLFRTIYSLVVFYIFVSYDIHTITSCLSDSQDPSLSLSWINLGLMHTKFKFYLYICRNT